MYELLAGAIGKAVDSFFNLINSREQRKHDKKMKHLDRRHEMKIHKLDSKTQKDIVKMKCKNDIEKTKISINLNNKISKEDKTIKHIDESFF